jgi:putative nucleotidyltransferase with HDIG domain
MAEAAGNRLLQAEVQHEMARVHHEESRNRDAIQALNMAYRLYEQMQARREMLDIENHLTALEHSYISVVRAWATSTIECKDEYTVGHSTRVADLTRALGAAMGVKGHDLVWLQVGALLHDMGKMTVPPSVLSKAGPLNASEWQLMQRHTTVGDQIVKSLDLPYVVAPMARHHHERFDGRGYPDNIAGQDIPIEARMLAVADQYDALTSRRSYRQEFSPKKAMEILRVEAGHGLDPDCVAVFEKEVWPMAMERV